MFCGYEYDLDYDYNYDYDSDSDSGPNYEAYACKAPSVMMLGAVHARQTG